MTKDVNGEIEFSQLDFVSGGPAKILNGLTANFSKGSFTALLGENGAGKTTLLDMVMGFKKPSSGTVKVQGVSPHDDNWQERQQIVYLSEKMDIPGDWTVREFLNFNKFFYKNYSEDLEQSLMKDFRVSAEGRLGNMSAGEIRRVQIVGALATQPQLIIVDEITAVLDIVGRRRFMKHLLEQNKARNCTVLLATNILEDLQDYISDVMLMQKGQITNFAKLETFLGGKDKHAFAQLVAERLEAAQ